MIRKYFKNIFNSPLARRLFGVLSVFAILVVMLITGLQLYHVYQRDIDELQSQLTDIQNQHVEAITQSVWSTNKKEVSLQLKGIIGKKYIVYAVIQDSSVLLAYAGNNITASYVQKKFPLAYVQKDETYDIGTLTVVASLDVVKSDVIDEGLSLLFYNTVFVFVLFIFVFILFDRVVTRHLVSSSQYIKRLDMDKNLSPLVLDRNINSVPDEIDSLVSELNLMQIKTNTLMSGLRKNEQEFRAIADYTYDWESWFDPDGKLIWVNPAVERITGYTVEECIAMDGYPLPMIVDKERNILKSLFSNIMQEEHRGSDFNFTIRFKNGELRNVAMCWQPIYSIDSIYLGIRSSIRDITEIKQAEEERNNLQTQLMQSQKMESIGQLTGGIAHDFNNMLGIILGYAELLKNVNENDTASIDGNKGYINEIQVAGNRAKELIAQMLTFSRSNPVDNDNSDAPLTTLKTIVKEVVSLVRSSTPKTIDVLYRSDDEDLKAYVQPVHLHQILLNLCINARDSIKEYGQIEITLLQESITENCTSCHKEFTGEYAVLTVKDNGEGIRHEYISKIFDPFFTTKEVGKGTGMGLSVVHGVVHKLGGHVTISSEEFEHTTISIYFPLVAFDAIQYTDRQAEVPKFSSGVLSDVRVMVVDDEYAMNSMLTELLSTHGAVVTSFVKPVEALKFFQKNPYMIDIIVTDETMPELSGLHMSKFMLDIRPELPVILCTGHSEYVNQAVAQEAGLAGFMYKPIDINKLVQMVLNLAYKEDSASSSLN